MHQPVDIYDGLPLLDSTCYNCEFEGYEWARIYPRNNFDYSWLHMTWAKERYKMQLVVKETQVQFRIQKNNGKVEFIEENRLEPGIYEREGWFE